MNYMFFLRLNEFVLTECHIYGAVRVGGWQKITMKMFRSAFPIWVHEDQKILPTNLPESACRHQKAADDGDQMAKIGLCSDGTYCCEVYVPQVGFALPNTKDKGVSEKKLNWIIMPTETYRFLQDLLVIRDSYFSSCPGKLSTKPTEWWKEGDCGIFLSNTGQDVGSGNMIRMNLFNEVVLGKGVPMLITSQMIRASNSTFVHNHEDPTIRTAREAITGNTEIVFQHHYNLSVMSSMVSATIAMHCHHHGELNQEQSPVVGKELNHQLMREFHEQADTKREAINAATSIDKTSISRPTAPNLRERFKKAINALEPDLWKHGGRQGNWNRKNGLTMTAWTNKVCALSYYSS